MSDLKADRERATEAQARMLTARMRDFPGITAEQSAEAFTSEQVLKAGFLMVTNLLFFGLLLFV